MVKKNYTLKIILALLIVILSSLVSFVGVYKGRNLVKDYSLGMDLGDKRVAMYEVKEDESNESSSEESSSDNENSDSTENNQESENSEEAASEQTSDEQQNAENSEKSEAENKTETYKKAKNIIEKRLASMDIKQYNVRLDEETGNLAIEISADEDPSYLGQVILKGEIKVVNKSNSDETILESSDFKGASFVMDTTNYLKPTLIAHIKIKGEAVKKLKNANKNYTDSDGNESEATFALTIDGETISSDTANNFAQNFSGGVLQVPLWQDSDKEKLTDYTKRAEMLTAFFETEPLPCEYSVKSTAIIQSDVNINSIAIIAIIAWAVLFVVAVIKFKNKAVLPMISLIGLVAISLLVLRYTNVKITIFAILGLAVVALFNYFMIFRSLSSEKTFKEDMLEMLKIFIPCLIFAVVSCCAPYIELATFGMTIFWSSIVMIVYNIVVTKTFLNK